MKIGLVDPVCTILCVLRGGSVGLCTSVAAPLMRTTAHGGTMKTKRYLILALLLVGTILGVQGEAEASHFRFGHVTWTPTAGGPANDATFSVLHAWRRSACPGTGVGGFVAIGDPACGFATLFFGDGGSAPITGTVVSIDPTNDWYLATYTTTHTYPTPNSGGTPWLAQLSGCCRIYAPQVNAPGTSFSVQTEVDLSTGNSSPVSTIVPIIQMAVNTVNSIAIPVGDVDGDTLTCRLATNAESGIANQPGPPNGGAVNSLSVTPGCSLQWDTTGTAVGQLWATQIVIEEGVPAHGRVGLEFLILIVADIGDPPVCDVPPTPTGTVTVFAGSPYTATIQGSDIDVGDTLTLNSSGLPAGASTVPALPTSSASPVSSVLSWTPGLAQVGPHPMFFTITDQTGQQANCPFTIDVQLGIPVKVDLKPGSNPNCVIPQGKGGSAVSVTIFGSADFDVTDVDTSTVVFGGASVTRSSIEDSLMEDPTLTFTQDGIPDLVLKFKKADMTFPAEGSNCAFIELTGETLDGTPITGGDVLCLPGEENCNGSITTPVPSL
jgi:hypothetical protein